MGKQDVRVGGRLGPHRIDHAPIGGLAGQKFAEGAETGEIRGIKTTGLNTARGKREGMPEMIGRESPGSQGQQPA